MQPPWHPVGLLLNPPKSSQSNVSYGSYESGELCKKKPLQEALTRFKEVIAKAKKLALKGKAVTAIARTIRKEGQPAKQKQLQPKSKMSAAPSSASGSKVRRLLETTKAI